MADASSRSDDNPFKSLLGEISEEQWETYKALKRQQGNLVLDDSSDSAPSGDETHPHETTLYVEVQAQPEAETTKVEDDSSDSSDGEDKETLQSQSDITKKYITGEITFAELTEYMEAKSPSTEASEAPSSQKPSDESDDPLDEYLDSKSKRRSRRRRKNKKKKKCAVRRSRLPRDLQGLMGEANLRFAKGDHEDAIKMCMEVIRLVPIAPEPFQTLGMIYEEMGDSVKSLQYALIGAYLSPEDADEWARLGELSLEQGDVRQASTCYARAVRADPQNVDLRLELCTLYEQLGEQKRALECCNALLTLMGPKQGAQCMQLAREVAKVYHQMGSTSTAVQALEKVFNKFPSHIASEDVNMLLELQLSEKMHYEALLVLTKHCGIEFSLPGEQSDVAEVLEKKNISMFEQCTVPDLLPIDLQAKLIVCLVHLGAHNLVQGLVEDLQKENIEEVGDLYLDVAEAYMEQELYSQALPLLQTLVATVNYNLAAVWLRYAECLQQLGRLEEATDVYRRVCKMAPAHAEARMALCTLLLKRGHRDDAVSALRQDCEDGNDETDPDVTVLLRRTELLYEFGQKEAFVEAAMLLLQCHCPSVENESDYSAVYSNFSSRGRYDALKDLQKKRGIVSKHLLASDLKISMESLVDIFTKLCQILYDLNRWKDLQYVTTITLASPLLTKEPAFMKNVEFMSLMAHYKDPNMEEHSFFLARAMVLRNPHSNKAWNLFGLAVNMSPVMRHNRFCLRLLYKYPDNVALGLLNGHNALVSGTYKHALGEYMCLAKEHPDDPFVLLCVGLCFTHISCQKFTAKRHSLYVQAIAFMTRYLEMRGNCQESYYNVGRALHQLGLLHLAASYYKKALEEPPSLTVICRDENIFDLRKEIAFNLSQIYLASKNTDLAAMYINKYCII
ncbi:general transcription factor 3C polypeptide 3-like [Ornithodoros turicata]|uniref:general transcription factor 3C polypeptide 3-like n=1 Tax=Ornithodoros turicata TaxID=34597 RepID=UPI0031393443